MRLVSFPYFDREIGLTELRPSVDIICQDRNKTVGKISPDVLWKYKLGDHAGLVRDEWLSENGADCFQTGGQHPAFHRALPLS